MDSVLKYVRVPFAVSAVSVNVCSGDDATLSFAGGIPCWIRSKGVATFEEWHTQKERKVARKAVKSEANANKDILQEITKSIPTDVLKNVLMSLKMASSRSDKRRFS